MAGLFLAMYSDEVTLGQAGFISIFAMIVVFIVLLIISYMIDLTAFFLKGSNQVKKANGEDIRTAEPSPVNKKADGSADIVVIAAAVAAYLGTSVDNIKICKIRRVNQYDTTWTQNGLLTQINKK